jgi:hypothetical protein
MVLQPVMLSSSTCVFLSYLLHEVGDADQREDSHQDPCVKAVGGQFSDEYVHKNVCRPMNQSKSMFA